MYRCEKGHLTDETFRWKSRFLWWRFGGYLVCGVTRRVYFGGSNDGFDVPCAAPVKEVYDGDATERAIRQPERDDEHSGAAPDGGRGRK